MVLRHEGGRLLPGRQAHRDKGKRHPRHHRFHDREAEKGRARTEQSFMVPKAEIADNGYDLSINKYKQVEYVPVEYPPTAEILADLQALEAEIAQGLKELEGML